MLCRYFETPLGYMAAEEDNQGITTLSFRKPDGEPERQSGRYLEAVEEQVLEYFRGERRRFDLPLSIHGTPFQKSVWQALQNNPYGETRSYLDIAKAIGNPKACRAVGMANNRNPVVLLVPCHRVIGSTGALVGYAAGLERKEYLLKLEHENRI